MSERHLKVAVFFLFLAATAFVADVLSPATPTPNADVGVKLLPLFFCILALVRLFSLPLPEILFDRSGINSVSTRRHPRALIAWICVLLC